MAENTKPCIAITKAGAPCKRPAQPGSDYCAIHARSSVSAHPATTPAAPASPTASINQTELRQLAEELNALAEELRKFAPAFTPPPYSSQGLRDLLKQILERLAPEQRLQILQDIRNSFEGTSIDDFKDIETWKGMWFTLNYLASTEATKRKDWLLERLVMLPGMNAATGLKDMLAQTPPEEFLKPDTWKGMWFIVNYEVQNQAAGWRRRLFGSSAE